LDTGTRLPEEVGEAHAPSGLAICPLLGKAWVDSTDKYGNPTRKLVPLKCSEVDCLNCGTFEEVFSHEEHSWGCYRCADRVVAAGEADRHPFWSDGECDHCGRYSCVRTLLVS